MDNIINLFVYHSAAKRYAAARPCFHPLIVQRIVDFTGMSHFSHALDVACGTGQSSRALAEIAEHVIASDVSLARVAEAELHDRVDYLVAAAEVMPFSNNLFELITVGFAFHWFNQAAFLHEAYRVLKPDAWLVIYTSVFWVRWLKIPNGSRHHPVTTTILIWKLLSHSSLHCKTQRNSRTMKRCWQSN